MNEELDELGNYLLQLKKQTENQKNVISDQKKIIVEFRNERDCLIGKIKKLDELQTIYYN